MKKILIYNDYFFPGYKAGGPIQSIVNLIKILEKKYQVFVFTSSTDLGKQDVYDDIKENEWNSILLPGCSMPIDVWYGSICSIKYSNIKNIILDLQPDYLYLNGIYSLRFFLYPILAFKQLSLNSSLVICPRGMLQKGALQIKARKKYIFLITLKYLHLLDKTIWHATNEEEQQDIMTYFPLHQKILIAPNIPKSPFVQWQPSEKIEGSLRLVYLSLITEKKNLHLLLEALTATKDSITLSVYGPLKDKGYWETKCKPIIERLNGRVIYMGDVEPVNVQPVLATYDALAILTKGENFGHALYESLSVGRPLVTSYFTPWNDLEKIKAGWNVDIQDVHSIINQFNSIAAMGKKEFDEYCKGAHSLATNYFYNENFVQSYSELFVQ